MIDKAYLTTSAPPPPPATRPPLHWRQIRGPGTRWFRAGALPRHAFCHLEHLQRYASLILFKVFSYFADRNGRCDTCWRGSCFKPKLRRYEDSCLQDYLFDWCVVLSGDASRPLGRDEALNSVQSADSLSNVSLSHTFEIRLCI